MIRGTTRVDEQLDYKPITNEELEVGYRWYESHGVRPLFAFGHGLSYADMQTSGERAQVVNLNGDNDGHERLVVEFCLTHNGGGYEGSQNQVVMLW